MRKLLFAVALLAVAPLSAQAQRVELFGGYSYARVETASVSRPNVNGWNLALPRDAQAGWRASPQGAANPPRCNMNC